MAWKFPGIMFLAANPKKHFTACFIPFLFPIHPFGDLTLWLIGYFCKLGKIYLVKITKFKHLKGPQILEPFQ
jgi:hypothetical protein